MSDFAAIMEAAKAAEQFVVQHRSEIARAVELAREIGPELTDAEPAVKALVDHLFGLKF